MKAYRGSGGQWGPLRSDHLTHGKNANSHWITGLDGPQDWYGCFGEDENSLSLPEFFFLAYLLYQLLCLSPYERNEFTFKGARSHSDVCFLGMKM